MVRLADDRYARCRDDGSQGDVAVSRRVSHSILDPWLGPPIKRLYPVLPIPRWFPPEGIVVTGHLLAIVGAIGFAFSVTKWWGGLLVALGAAGNHFADCIDGTHARATNQCRNGGELLDHFTDPLSFAYWVFGWSWAVGRLELGIVGIICLYATAVLTNIKAKMVGEFTLATFGPTEFKTGLVLLGLLLSATVLGWLPAGWTARAIALWTLVASVVMGLVQLKLNLLKSIREVNRDGAPPDTSEWETVRQQDP